ncbi:MAG: LITAF-like zinc ribbon domain-containing protein [Promethearchaeota archaeon]
MKTGKKTVYCPTCEQNVILRRKNFDHIYHEILCFSVILTMGLGFILYLILKYSKPKDRCPNCEAQFDLNNLSDNEILEKDVTN